MKVAPCGGQWIGWDSMVAATGALSTYVGPMAGAPILSNQSLLIALACVLGLPGDEAQ